MATKNYHITPEGPKRCKASLRSCPYASHFGSEESAFAAQQILEADTKHRQKVKELKASLIRGDDRYVINGAISFFRDSRNGSVRAYAHTIEQRFRKTDVYPDVLRAKIDFYTQNGSYKPVEMIVKRDIEVDEETAKFRGTWKVTTSTKLSQYRGFEEIKQETTLDFSTEAKTKRSLSQIREVFRNGVQLGATYDIDEKQIDEETDRIFEKFKTTFNALESETLGDFEMWERGYGYFQGSDGQVLVANEDYETSAFRSENVRRFLKTNPYYASYVPRVEVRVSDYNKRTGAGWAVYKTNQKWYVSEKNEDGSESVYECADQHQVYSTVKRIVLEKVDRGEEAIAREKATYASDLMSDVEYYLDKHRTSVAKYWEEREKNSVANKKLRVNSDLYGVRNDEKSSVIKTIFDVFT